MKGFEFGGKYSQDPIGSEHARGKDCGQRKSGRDPGLTPSEKTLKDRLMRQFMRFESGLGAGRSEQYRDAWDMVFAKDLSDEERAECEARWHERLDKE